MIATANGTQRGLIYTFYSFKGGAGRSMALANVGALLAKWGYSVLVVDWDLEAPGIESFFVRENPEIADLRKTTPGIVDLVKAVDEGKQVSWRDCLLDVRIGRDSARLSLITAGQRDTDYSAKLHALDFPELFDKHNLGEYIEGLRDEWRSRFQFVLVDSRTGVTDIGGICTVHLADVLVLFFTTTDSSTEGALQILDRAREAHRAFPRDRTQLLAVPVPARDESRTEYERATEWKRKFSEEFDALYRDWLPSGITAPQAIERLKIPYVPYWSFGERLPAIEDETTDLSQAYKTLARLVAARLDWYKAFEGQEVAPPPIPRSRELDPEWLTRHRLEAADGLAKAGLPGAMELCHICSDVLVEKYQLELLSAATGAVVHGSGWPLGVVLDNRDEYRPKPTNEGILATISSPIPFEAGKVFDYWTLNKSGDFYALSSLVEDARDATRARKEIYFDIRIARATEALLHCGNLYKLLGIDPNVQIELRVWYSGLWGRSLTAASANRRNFLPLDNRSEHDVVVTPVKFRLGAIEAELIGLVKRLCEPLFVVFDYATFEDEVYRQIMQDFVMGKVA